MEKLVFRQIVTSLEQQAHGDSGQAFFCLIFTQCANFDINWQTIAKGDKQVVHNTVANVIILKMAWDKGSQLWCAHKSHD